VTTGFFHNIVFFKVLFLKSLLYAGISLGFVLGRLPIIVVQRPFFSDRSMAGVKYAAWAGRRTPPPRQLRPFSPLLGFPSTKAAAGAFSTRFAAEPPHPIDLTDFARKRREAPRRGGTGDGEPGLGVARGEEAELWGGVRVSMVR
jgi:hypothetical protein